MPHHYNLNHQGAMTNNILFLCGSLNDELRPEYAMKSLLKDGVRNPASEPV